MAFIVSHVPERKKKKKKKKKDCEVFGQEKMNEENNEGKGEHARHQSLAVYDTDALEAESRQRT